MEFVSQEQPVAYIVVVVSMITTVAQRSADLQVQGAIFSAVKRGLW